MYDDSCSFTVFDEGTPDVIGVAVVWEKSLPTNEFFSILLDEAESKIGRRILGKIGKFRSYFDEDDVISESMRKLLRRLCHPIDGVAEMSADGSTIYFNCWKRVFCYLRTIVKFCIIDMKRTRGAEEEKKEESQSKDNDTVSNVVAPVPTVVQQIKTQSPCRWIRAIENEASIPQRRVLLLQLKGLGDRQIAELLRTTHAKVRRNRINMISSFRQKFASPKDLLESLQS